MITYLNQKFRIVMLLGLAVVAVSFVFFGNWSSALTRGMGAIGKIDGRSIYEEQFRTEEKAFEVGTFFVTAGRVDYSRGDSSDIDNQTWARMVALEAAQKAGIIVTDAEVQKAMLENPFLQENGKYSPERHKLFVDRYLSPQGISETRFDDILREELTFRHFAAMIAGTATVQPTELEKYFDELYGEVSASMIRFDKASYLSQVKPTEIDLKNYHEAHKSDYAKPEERTVEYVKFEITPEEQKLKGKELEDALYNAGKKAFDFSTNFTQGGDKAIPDFDSVASQAGLSISRGTVVHSPDGTKDPVLSQPDVNSAALTLTKVQPLSDYIKLPTGYVILHLVDIHPAEPLPYEAVKQKVREDYISDHAEIFMREDAIAQRTKLESLLSQHKTWEQAAAELKLKTVAVPPFVPGPHSEPKIPEASLVAMMAPQMTVNTISGFEPTPEGGVLLYLEKRTAPDEKVRARFFPLLKQDIVGMKQKQLVTEWLITRMVSPGFQPPASLLHEFEQGL